MNTAKAYNKNEKVIRLHTYEQWERIHSRKQARKRAKKNKALLRLLCKISGIVMIIGGFAIPFVYGTPLCMSVLTFVSCIVTACLVFAAIVVMIGCGLILVNK